MVGDGPVIDGQLFTVALSFTDGIAQSVTLRAAYPLSLSEDCVARYPALLREATRELGALDAVIGESSFLLHVPPPGTSPPPVADAVPTLQMTTDGLRYYRFDIPEYRQVVLLNRVSGGRIALMLNSQLNEENPGGLPICEALIELRRRP